MDFKEKLALSGQLNSLIKDLKNNSLPLKERIEKGKERIAILKKLRADNIPAREVISLEQFKAMNRQEKIEVLDAVLRYENWYEYEMAFYPGYQLLWQDNNSVVFRNDLGGIQFGYRNSISRGIDYWQKDAGSSSKNGGTGSWGRAQRSVAIKAIKKYENSGPEELTVEDRFKMGAFSTLEASTFRKYLVMLKDRLSLDELKAGTMKWFEFNQSSLVDIGEAQA